MRRAEQPYHLYAPTVSKSGNLKLLEFSGPVVGLFEDCMLMPFKAPRQMHQKRHCLSSVLYPERVSLTFKNTAL